MPLEKAERETIIVFNPVDPNAIVFTYDHSWQRHLEQQLGLTPGQPKNEWGGKTYILPKKLISMPRKPRKATKAVLVGLEKARRAKSIRGIKPKTSVRTGKTGRKK